MPEIRDVVRFLESFAPLHLAADWDNIGLLMGDAAAQATRVMTCLTLTPDVAQEAQREGVQLIVSHHPVLFRATQKLTTATPEGALLLTLIEQRIAVYSPHTAFDNTAGGINDGLCRRLGLTDVKPLRSMGAPGLCKVVVFVPEADLARVSDALFAAGAGNIGQYSQCSFRLLGTGTFFGSDAANPAVGVKGRREEVSEWRLEAVCPESRVQDVVRAMREAHSYEEPAYDVYNLRPNPLGVGQGRVGVLPRAMALADLAQLVRQSLRANHIHIVGEDARPVRTVALACGAAGEFLRDAVAAGADVFLTGEMRFHDCIAARTAGIACVLPGHYASERPGVEDLAARIKTALPTLEVWASRDEKDPLHS
jgi:dinuclear metal center YbgI/SA1388 family protein